MLVYMPQKTLSSRDVLAKIQAEMSAQLTKSGAPEEVRDFLMRDWTRLLASIYLAKGNEHSDWKAGWETVNALLWSLAPKKGREETITLLRMLPTLLARLHEGCAALGLALAHRDALFERLALLHAAIAREGLQAWPDTEGGLGDMRVEESTVADQSALQDLAAPDLPKATQRGTLPTLKLGDRVVFKSEGKERRLLLNWISPMGGMYLFTNEQGLDAVSLTHARLESRFRNQEAWLAD